MVVFNILTWAEAQVLLFWQLFRWSHIRWSRYCLICSTKDPLYSLLSTNTSHHFVVFNLVWVAILSFVIWFICRFDVLFLWKVPTSSPGPTNKCYGEILCFLNFGIILIGIVTLGIFILISIARPKYTFFFNI